MFIAEKNHPAKLRVAKRPSTHLFVGLVRQHANNGVSGVLPKFLDTESDAETNAGSDFQRHQKVSFFTRKHIIKGSSARLPFAALNEHLCTQVIAKGLPAARTEVSGDVNALVVYRFDVDADGQLHCGMEDFCALLGLRPAQKYDTTWERTSRAVRDHVPGERQYETFRHLAVLLLLTYALRNADCHAKNLALLYTSRRDVRISPAYDFLTTCVYEGYQYNPPGIGFLGKKTWAPGKNLTKFVAGTFGISVRDQTVLVESISDAVAGAVPLVQSKMEEIPAFRDLGKRILIAWQEGVAGLRDRRVYAVGEWQVDKAFEGISDPPKL
jgi:serine/threonine-protein kinase HipA